MTKLHNAMHSFAKQFLPDLHHLPTHTGAKNALFFLGLFGFGTMMFSQVSANVNISTSLNNSVMTIEKLIVTPNGQTSTPTNPRSVELNPAGMKLNLGSPTGVLKRNSDGYVVQGLVSGSDIGNGAIGSNHIQDGAIGANQIASGAIGSAHIASGAITCDKLNIPGFTCSGVAAPNGACPTGQFLQGINANGSYNCAPIGGGNNMPNCTAGQIPQIQADGTWGCGALGIGDGDQLWEKLSFLSPHIYNKNRDGGRVGVGLTNPQTTLHVKGTFLVGKKDGTVEYQDIGQCGNSNGYDLSAYPGIQACSCESGDCTGPSIQATDVGEYCYASTYVGGPSGNGTSYGGSATSSWRTCIYQKPKPVKPIEPGKEGESCYGSRAGSRNCAEGLVCRDEFGNNPMHYDGVGVCVKDIKIQYIFREVTNSNGRDLTYPGIRSCSCDTDPEAKDCLETTSMADGSVSIESNDVGMYCYDGTYVGGPSGNGTSYGGSATSSWSSYIYKKEIEVSCGTRYLSEASMDKEGFDRFNYQRDIPKCSCDTNAQGQQCASNEFIGNNVGEMCYDANLPGPTEKRLPIYHLYRFGKILGPDCATDNGACTTTGNFGTTTQLAVADPSAIFYVGDNAVGILTKNPQYALDVVGTVRATQVLTLSDARLKTNITPIGNALKKLMGIQGYIYDLKVDGSTQYGVLAQQVEEFFPYAVITAENGLKSVNYSSLVAPMIQAIHELDSKVQTLEKTYQSNESRIQAIEEKLGK